ncbi:MAG: alginate export family protein [Pseudomonadota bacterium]
MPRRPDETPTRVGACVLVIVMFGLMPREVVADPCAPAFAKLRFEDDLACYTDLSSQHHLLDPLKRIELPGSETVVLSFGGEIRERYEFTNNPRFGDDPQDPRGVWLQRLALHGDLQLGDHVRLFGQLLSGTGVGRAGGPSPVDENRLAFQNAFLELDVPLGNQVSVGTRIGRQEMALGSERLISVREGPNVRRTFDAARGWIDVGDWRIDGLAARPRDPERGVFDDGADRDKGLWGVYASGTPAWLPAGALDLYYFGFADENGLFDQETADELRHSLGVRIYGDVDGWDWNWEGVYQFGSFGTGDINAWTIGTETGFTFQNPPWQPRIALSANIASGDDDPDDPDLGTFNPLFPRGNYFSEAAVLGPRNFYNLHGFLTVTPVERLSLQADLNVFWRLDRDDGVYSPSGQIIRPGGGTERFVGSALSLSAEYEVTPRLSLTTIYTRFFSGDVIDTSGTAKDIDFIELTAQFKF